MEPQLEYVVDSELLSSSSSSSSDSYTESVSVEPHRDMSDDDSSRGSKTKKNNSPRKHHSFWSLLEVLKLDRHKKDHNHDIIVLFPDWNPIAAASSDVAREYQIQNLLTPHRNRRSLFSEMDNPLPKAHLWYSTLDVIKALRLFLDVGSELAGSLTYSVYHSLSFRRRQMKMKISPKNEEEIEERMKAEPICSLNRFIYAGERMKMILRLPQLWGFISYMGRHE